MSQLDDVKDLARAMRELGIRRASMTRDGIEVELFGDPTPPAAERASVTAPAAPGPAPAEPGEVQLPPDVQRLLDDAKPEVCACGHLWSEHGDAGCFHGCDMGSCGRAETPPPDAKEPT